MGGGGASEGRDGRTNVEWEEEGRGGATMEEGGGRRDSTAAAMEGLTGQEEEEEERERMEARREATGRAARGSGAALLSVETHRRAATGNTKSREVAGALAVTAPSSTARNSVTRPEIPKNVGRAT